MNRGSLPLARIASWGSVTVLLGLWFAVLFWQAFSFSAWRVPLDLLVFIDLAAWAVFAAFRCVVGLREAWKGFLAGWKGVAASDVPAVVGDADAPHWVDEFASRVPRRVAMVLVVVWVTAPLLWVTVLSLERL